MPYDEYTSDSGESLTFRMVHHGAWIPVVISREAMEDHFGVDPSGRIEALAEAYRKRSLAIEERVRPQIRPGVVYDRNNPLRINTTDL